MSTDTRAHTFDGIQEFDSRLPNWWLWSFYIACVFSVFYWVFFHTIGIGDLPSEAYLHEQQLAATRMEERLASNPVSDEVLLKMASEPAFVAEGKKMFEDMTKCALCHKADGSGLIGPNLTDDMWIYGGKPMDIYTSILRGRPRGMLPHEQYGLGFVQRTTAFVLSIKNTRLPGKEPEPDAKKEQ
jgi:cytochrome c oxidase cbb3-type subunit 3